MAFEPWNPQKGIGRLPPEGCGSLSSGGMLKMRAFDAKSLNILGPTVAILVDRETRRIGLRHPPEDFGGRTLPIRPHGKAGILSKVGLGRVMRDLGLVPRELAGNVELMCKDEMIMIGPLRAASRATSGAPAAGQARRRKPKIDDVALAAVIDAAGRAKSKGPARAKEIARISGLPLATVRRLLPAANCRLRQRRKA